MCIKVYKKTGHLWKEAKAIDSMDMDASHTLYAVSDRLCLIIIEIYSC